MDQPDQRCESGVTVGERTEHGHGTLSLQAVTDEETARQATTPDSDRRNRQG
jgi:hypothetical protein